VFRAKRVQSRHPVVVAGQTSMRVVSQIKVVRSWTGIVRAGEGTSAEKSIRP
jgi:hypothetical protein